NKKTAITLGLRAANESNAEYWKKFLANGESSPTSRSSTIVPQRAHRLADEDLPRRHLRHRNALYRHLGTDRRVQRLRLDADGNLKYLHLKVWRAGYPAARSTTPTTPSTAAGP
ncbi:hypothetical protein RB196_34615, partial [Streptomyces sp. PmtA]|uniref:hypothetical protein n=1 Tax=Streptomyces sp. PmtA TaxID=3074275 RepID=UPI0030152CAA